MNNMTDTKILIVDDDAVVRSSLTFLLKRAGYLPTAVGGPKEALQKVREEDFRLVLMDMNFTLTTTGEEGIHLLKQVKILRPDLPVILMTAWGSISLAVQGMQAGAFDFITKPWNNLVLLKAIRNALELYAPVGKEEARQIIGVVDKAREKCLKTCGEAFFYAADEFYLKAGLPLPGEEYYNGYPQLENGVGLMSLFRQELQGALLMAEPTENPPAFLIATGVSAAPFMEEMVALCKEKCPALQGRVQPVKNDFFGHGVDVAGLLTGGDIIRQVKDVLRSGEELWIPDCMLRHGETVFLDDVSVEEMEQSLGTKVRVLPVDGGAFCDAIFPWEE